MNNIYFAWKCPTCNFIITDVEMQSYRYDFGCPVCGCSFTLFIFCDL